MKKKQLSHPAYYKFRQWIEKFGEEKSYGFTSQEIANQATELLKFDVPVSAVASTLKDLGWNKRKDGRVKRGANEEFMQLLVGLELRVASNEAVISELLKRLPPSKQ